VGCLIDSVVAIVIDGVPGAGCVMAAVCRCGPDGQECNEWGGGESVVVVGGECVCRGVECQGGGASPFASRLDHRVVEG
jgi:hypothetical protein